MTLKPKKLQLEAINRFAFTISDFWLFRGVRRGLIYSMPFILTGSIALLTLNFPLNAVTQFFSNGFGLTLKEFLLIIYNSTFSIMSLMVLLGISYEIANEDPYLHKEGFPVVLILIVSLTCFFINASEDILLPAPKAGATGLFGAILISIFSSKIFIWFYKKKFLSRHTYIDSADNTLYHSLSSIIPCLFTICLFVFVTLFLRYTGFNQFNLHQIVLILDKTNSLLATILFDLLSHIMWFFGIHGNNVLQAADIEIFTYNSHINSALVAAGKAPKEIFTKQFNDIFVFMGGSGTTLCLIIALILGGRKSKTNQLAKISLGPAVFNINEIIIYGLPIVLNPVFLIPFILTPIVLTLISFTAIYLGLVPMTINENVQWTVPVLWGGYLATHSIAGSLLQLFNLIVGVMIYLPFVHLNDKLKLLRNQKTYKSFIDKVLNESPEVSAPALNTLAGDFGSLARTLTRDIKAALKSNDGLLFLEYQPQVDPYGKVYGAEALLRWNHKRYGRIPPPIIVRIAEENGMTDLLGNWVINTAIEGLKRINDHEIKNIIISINLSPQQIQQGTFVSTIQKQIAKTKVNPTSLEFELTENAAITPSKETITHIETLRKMGCFIAIDDFGMGHTSLHYVKDFNVNTIKLDGSLVKDILTDVNTQEIVASITSLSKSLNLNVIAEVVETLEQKEMLEKIGCNIYQGYYYSKPLSFDDFIVYAKEKGTIKEK